MTLDLDKTCQRMLHLDEFYDYRPNGLYAEEAAEIFRKVWAHMTAGPNSNEIDAAIALVAKTFNI